MVRPNRRSMLGDRLKAAAEEAADAEAGRGRRDSAFFDRLAELGVPDPDAPQQEAGEVFGAGTGRAARSIQATDVEDVRWDSQRAYPQVQNRTTNPERPRSVASGYDPKNAILRVTFREGATYEYLGVPPRVWSTFQKVASPGRYIDDVLDQYPYRPAIMEE